MHSKPLQFCAGIALCLLLIALPLQAKTASEALIVHMNQLEGLRSDFVQTIYASGNVVESSKGTMALAKPKLRWQVDAPFAQVIVVRPQRIEIYDADLAQLTIRETSADQTATPASLLMHPEHLLSADYQVSQFGNADARVFRLTPTGSSALFQRLEITFERGTLESLVIIDWQEQQTQIRFENVLVDQNLSPSLFELSVPKGTDVIRG